VLEGGEEKSKLRCKDNKISSAVVQLKSPKEEGTDAMKKPRSNESAIWKKIKKARGSGKRGRIHLCWTW